MAHRTSRRRKDLAKRVILHIVLISISAVMLVPFLWQLSTSLKESGTEFAWPPQWIPRPPVWRNYVDALTLLPFDIYLKNSLIISVSATFGSVMSAALAGYGFARLRFPGRDFLFGLCLSVLMLPGVVTLIPQFILFRHLGWVDTFKPLIVPAYFGGSAFATFMIRQFFLTIPLELDEAARIDGAGSFRIFGWILLPLLKPALITMGILNFLFYWNDFMGPLIYISSSEKMTLTLGLRAFQGQWGTEWNYMMAASAVMTVPVLILFFSAQRYFMEGIVMTGLKG